MWHMIYGSSKYYCNAWLEPNLGQILSSSGRVGLQEVGDPGEYNTFLNSRPPSMELSAIQLVVDICRETRVPCHIGRWQGYMGTLIHESESDEVSMMVKGRRIYGNADWWKLLQFIYRLHLLFQWWKLQRLKDFHWLWRLAITISGFLAQIKS